MLIKAAVTKNCEKCHRFVKEISPEQHGCDQCKKPIVPYRNDERLEVSVFHKQAEVEHSYFCSWKCVFKFVKKLKTDHFFTLPYVVSDHKIQGRRAIDFQAAIRMVR